MDPFLAAALDSAVRVLRNWVVTGELSDETMAEEEMTAMWLALALHNVNLPVSTGTLDALLAWSRTA